MTDKAISPLRRRLIEDMTIRRLSANTQHQYEESVANLLQALRAVRFNDSRTGSDRILARIGFVRQKRSSPRITVAGGRAVPVPAVVASRH